LSESTRNVPAATTRSPSTRPRKIATRSESLRPVSTCRGSEHPLAALYEHALLASRVNQRIQGHGESRRHAHRQFHVDKHVRTQGKSGVVRFEPQLQSPGNGIDLRKGVAHAG